MKYAPGLKGYLNIGEMMEILTELKEGLTWDEVLLTSPWHKGICLSL